MIDQFDFFPTLPPLLQAIIVTKMERASFFKLPHVNKWGLAAYEGSRRREEHEANLRVEKAKGRIMKEVYGMRELNQQMNAIIDGLHNSLNDIAEICASVSAMKPQIENVVQQINNK